jgi:hypothetical protein
MNSITTIQTLATSKKLFRHSSNNGIYISVGALNYVLKDLVVLILKYVEVVFEARMAFT